MLHLTSSEEDLKEMVYNVFILKFASPCLGNAGCKGVGVCGTGIELEISSVLVKCFVKKHPISPKVVKCLVFFRRNFQLSSKCNKTKSGTKVRPGSLQACLS